MQIGGFAEVARFEVLGIVARLRLGHADPHGAAQPARQAASMSRSVSPISQLAARSTPSSSRARHSSPGRGLAAFAVRVRRVGTHEGRCRSRRPPPRGRRAAARGSARIRESEVAAPDAALVGDDREAPAGVGEPAQRGRDAGEQLVVREPVRVADVANQRAVAVEQDVALHRAPAASSAAIAPHTSSRTALAATLTAFSSARSRERPCALITMRSKPRIGAPP